MSKMVEIIDNVYIGPISEIYKKTYIDKIDVIVNCTKEQYETDKIYYCVPVDDTEMPENIDSFVKYSNTILPELIIHYKNGKRIYIHCSQGVQRSAAFVSIFLVKLNNITLEESIEFVLSKKSNCFSHGRRVNFMEAIIRMN